MGAAHETKDNKGKNTKGRTKIWVEPALGVNKLSGCVGPLCHQGAPKQTENMNSLWF